MGFKFLPHTADVKVLAEADSLEDCFKQAAFALKNIIIGDAEIKSKVHKKIKIKSTNLESLFYNFIEELIYLLDAEDFILKEVEEIKIDEKTIELKAKFSGDKASDYKFTNDVKAITYNDMKIKNQRNKYTIQFVLDV